MNPEFPAALAKLQTSLISSLSFFASDRRYLFWFFCLKTAQDWQNTDDGKLPGIAFYFLPLLLFCSNLSLVCSDLHTFPHHPRVTVLSAKQAAYYTALIVTIKVIHQMVQCVDVYVSHAFTLRFTFSWQPIHLNLITYCSSFPKQIDWWSSRVCFVNYNVQHAQKPKTLYFFFVGLSFFFSCKFISMFKTIHKTPFPLFLRQSIILTYEHHNPSPSPPNTVYSERDNLQPHTLTLSTSQPNSLRPLNME